MVDRKTRNSGSKEPASSSTSDYGFVVLMDADRTEVARWKFSDAWIRKLEGPKLNAKGNDVAIETIVLVCEDLEFEVQ